MSELARWRHACVLMALAVIALTIACWFLARTNIELTRPVIVVAPDPPAVAYNDGPNYEYQKRRWIWRHV